MLSSRARIFNTPRQVFFWLSAREAFFVSFVGFYQQTFSVCLILVHLSIQILTLEIHSFKPLRYISLRKKCPFSELLWSAFFPHFSRIFPQYREVRSISPHSVWMRENAGKMQTRITPNTDTFYTVFTSAIIGINCENQLSLPVNI